jgi:ribonuclease E
MSTMIINAAHNDEIRVALTNPSLYDIEIEKSDSIPTKSNIYANARITRIEPSLEAAFVDYGSERHGFLPLREVAPEYFNDQSGDKKNEKKAINELLQVGQRLTVQIEKEERDNKGAALTTFISLAGSYLVLMPNNPKVGGISRRIEGGERESLKSMYQQLRLPEMMGVIIRTAGLGKKLQDLQWDLDTLINHWQAVRNALESLPKDKPTLLHQDGNVVIRAIRDNLRADIKEVIVDDPKTHELAQKYISQIKPDFESSQVKLYEHSEPIFSFYGVERAIEKARQREVQLASGGVIVIDRTEALVAIDINSSKATKGSDIEQTALQTNLEAAEEIARQLRLRDLGGLIVIDFIDMSNQQHQRQVEDRLKEALSVDRARIKTGKISRFGLLEMSRQRLKNPLEQSYSIKCPRCDGQGWVINIEQLATNLIRLLQQEATNPNHHQVQLYVPTDVATFLLNEHRNAIHQKKNSLPATYSLIAPKNFKTPKAKQSGASQGIEKAAVGHYLDSSAARPSAGILRKIKTMIVGNDLPPQSVKPNQQKNSRRKPSSRSRNKSNDNRKGHQQQRSRQRANQHGSSKGARHGQNKSSGTSQQGQRTKKNNTNKDK